MAFIVLDAIEDANASVLVAEKACEIVYNVMRTAYESNRHTPSSWKKEGHLHHISHAEDHTSLAGLIAEDQVEAEPYDLIEELDHAITRLVLARISIDLGILGDFGDEGEGNG